jgi:predicted phosphodiesterase
MKIITYSDLHLEFGTGFLPPQDSDADVMILAGDICVLKDYELLDQFLVGWKKPILYVTGNHEYYTRRSMTKENADLKVWLAETHPNVRLLLDEAVNIDGVNFFGGTMWTNFAGYNRKAMNAALNSMNDFRLIRTESNDVLMPADTIDLHEAFVKKLTDWFETPLLGARVIVTHHAPVINPNTKYQGSELSPAFNSLDMEEIISKYQPELWVYGHTHECDRQTVGKTKIVSNQLGYPNPHSRDSYECADFDAAGAPVTVGN